VEKDDEEITIDFSKVKNLFKRSEKKKVEDVEKKAEEVKAASDEDKEKVEEIKQDLKKQETEAAIIDGEEKVIDKKIEEEKKELSRIEAKAEADDEIAIDFSKIKNFFKGKEKKAESTAKKDDDEISFDFSKIKNFFKGSKDQDNEEGVDWKSTWQTIKKYQLLILVMIPIILSLYLRLMPTYLPITDDWAQSTINNNIQQQVAAQIQAQYPNLPQAQRNNLINSQLQQVMEQNAAQFKAQKDQLSEQFKSRLQLDGQTYLIAIDPYFWLYHAENIINNGHPGHTLRNPQTREECQVQGPDCVPWDDLMYAPLGRPVPGDMFHAYVIAYTHKVMSVFNPDQRLMTSSFFIPAILSALCVIPAFFITRRIGGNLGGLIAAVFVAIHPAFLSRTAAGFSDTDAYNVLFPLFITWLFLEAFERRKDWKKGVALVTGASLLTGIYSLAWGGWWYIFLFLLGALVLFLGIHALVNRDQIKTIYKQATVKHSGLILAVFFVATAVFVSLMSGFHRFMGAFRGPLGFIQLKEVGINTVWPNVFMIVAEQNVASL
jgi:hypothetical protein